MDQAWVAWKSSTRIIIDSLKMQANGLELFATSTQTNIDTLRAQAEGLPEHMVDRLLSRSFPNVELLKNVAQQLRNEADRLELERMAIVSDVEGEGG